MMPSGRLYRGDFKEREILQTVVNLDMNTFKVPVGVSNHHVHLSHEHIEILYGAGHLFTPNKYLSQSGQYAAEEMATLIGPKGSIDGVRVLGPGP